VIDSFRLNRNSMDQYDLTKLNSQQYVMFRYHFVEQCMHNPTYQNVENPKAMELLLSVLCMALCNKVPKGVVPYKMDQVYHKIRLVNIPKGLEIVRREVIENGEVTGVFDKNTNERALVRVLVPKRKLTLSEIAAED